MNIAIRFGHIDKMPKCEHGMVQHLCTRCENLSGQPVGVKSREELESEIAFLTRALDQSTSRMQITGYGFISFVGLDGRLIDDAGSIKTTPDLYRYIDGKDVAR